MHATICDFFADTVQNSVEAGASRIEALIAEDDIWVKISVKDNGKGMGPETLARVWDPFYTEPGKHSGRRVGLGLPLLRQTAEGAGGSVSISSAPGKGTVLDYCFAAHGIDTPPVGDVAGTVLSLMNYGGEFEFIFTHRRKDAEYSVARLELADAVGGLHNATGIVLARDFLREREKELNSNA